MTLQKFLQNHANQLTALSAVLIVLGYIGKYGLSSTAIWDATMLVASLLGGVPIAIHAFEALRVKQISIDPTVEPLLTIVAAAR
ncbi:MAG: hypothetical protein LBI43_03835 [Streptococcaceae bacterium]|jgi:Cd2+/Zn2+-exporting ATPase|nr:hypothetical protein [Streptococcaceae bacterium]